MRVVLRGGAQAALAEQTLRGVEATLDRVAAPFSGASRATFPWLSLRVQINRAHTGVRSFQNGADAGRCRLIVVVARPRQVGFLRCPALGERLTRERVGVA